MPPPLYSPPSHFHAPLPHLPRPNCLIPLLNIYIKPHCKVGRGEGEREDLGGGGGDYTINLKIFFPNLIQNKISRLPWQRRLQGWRLLGSALTPWKSGGFDFQWGFSPQQGLIPPPRRFQGSVNISESCNFRSQFDHYT